MHLIDLVVGDYSGDGHNMTETVTVKCNLTKEALLEVNKSPLIREFLRQCSSYQEDKLTDGFIDKLEKVRILIDDPCMDSQSFVSLYMNLVYIYNPELKWEFLPQNKKLEIGGYGLFEP